MFEVASQYSCHSAKATVLSSRAWSPWVDGKAQWSELRLCSANLLGFREPSYLSLSARGGDYKPCTLGSRFFFQGFEHCSSCKTSTRTESGEWWCSGHHIFQGLNAVLRWFSNIYLHPCAGRWFAWLVFFISTTNFLFFGRGKCILYFASPG